MPKQHEWTFFTAFNVFARKWKKVTQKSFYFGLSVKQKLKCWKLEKELLSKLIDQG